MLIISKSILTEFGEKHPDSIVGINEWWEKTKAADWTSFQDIKSTYNPVDYVGNDRFVFNIRGNKYRLVAMIFFNIDVHFLKAVHRNLHIDAAFLLTHA